MTRMMCAVWLSLAVASSQSITTGKIVGTVTDASGAMVPKAQVQLVNTDTNAASIGHHRRFWRLRISLTSRPAPISSR